MFSKTNGISDWSMLIDQFCLEQLMGINLHGLDLLPGSTVKFPLSSCSHISVSQVDSKWILSIMMSSVYIHSVG